jgi:hypothetical protein
VSTPPEALQYLAAAVSPPTELNIDDFYEYYDPNAESEPQLPGQIGTPVSQRRPPSVSSGSSRSLRRTSRLHRKHILRSRATIPTPPKSDDGQSHLRAAGGAAERGLPPELEPSFDETGSTTPQTFRRIVSQESFWPRRSTRISRGTHEAILFALQAIRTGGGKNYKSLSADLLEESARMSDLLPGDQFGVSNGNARTQNGGTRAARGAPVPAAGVRTPTEVMRARRERDARKKAQEEEQARLRLEQEDLRRQQEEEAAGGVAAEEPVRRRSARRSAADTQDTGRRTSGSQFTSRRQENLPPSAGVTSRSRATTLDQGQPRPVSQQPRVSKYEQQPSDDPGIGPSRLRGNPPAPTGEDAPNPRIQPQPPAQAQPQSSTQPQSGRSSFPHAFERWETLSSHWEGLTSYWIRRLQENSNELSREPLNQQMSRQITDLSAAGANLFHAVVELQRLRASSERKFQRWFFETRAEQEKYQETQAELERQLRLEREERIRVVSSTGTAEAERIKAEELVREMRRELQISKEEARRAWEELGRREQEERDRTVSLRSGEPTLVGGVQVVPMTQGVPSRQTTVGQGRPQTRDGPYAGGPSGGMMGGQSQAPASESHTTLESPTEEERQFSYQPAAGLSPTDTDPFTEEAARAATQPTSRPSESSRPPREALEFYQRTTQPLTSSAAIAALRAGQAQTYPTTTTAGDSRIGYTSAHQATTATTNGSGAGRLYQQGVTSAALQPPISAAAPPSSLSGPARPGTRNTDPSSLGERSYIPSTASGNGSSLGDEEYEIDQEGNFRRDQEGRRMARQAMMDQKTNTTSKATSNENANTQEDMAVGQCVNSNSSHNIPLQQPFQAQHPAPSHRPPSVDQPRHPRNTRKTCQLLIYQPRQQITQAKATVEVAGNPTRPAIVTRQG